MARDVVAVRVRRTGGAKPPTKVYHQLADAQSGSTACGQRFFTVISRDDTFRWGMTTCTRCTRKAAA